MAGPDDLRAGICAIAKDEGSYLEEWVAYHHLEGFSPIRVYAHECTDNTHAVLARLARFGLCEWEPFVSPLNRKPQWVAYEHGMEALRDRADWLAFVDLDEFVVTPRHASIQAFLAEYGHLGAIAVNRKMFGSGGQLEREPGLVMERFTRCAPRDFGPNRAVKLLARTDAVAVPRVHTAHFVPGTVYQTVIGEPLAEHAGRSDRVTHDVIRIHHYFTRSLAEWEQKSERGRSAKKVNSPLKHRTREEFDAQDRNEERDTELLRWVEPVEALIAGLRAADLDQVHVELDAEQRRARQLANEVARLREEVAVTTSRGASLQAALQAETRRAERLEAEVEALHDRLEQAGVLVSRVAGSTSWRVGSGAVRVARAATLRRTEGDSALDAAARALDEPPAPEPSGGARSGEGRE